MEAEDSMVWYPVLKTTLLWHSPRQWAGWCPYPPARERGESATETVSAAWFEAVSLVTETETMTETMTVRRSESEKERGRTTSGLGEQQQKLREQQRKRKWEQKEERRRNGEVKDNSRWPSWWTWWPLAWW